jgi:hypothetical protein
MFDGVATLAHLLWVLVGPALHCFEILRVLPAGDAAFLAGVAAMFEGASLADILLSSGMFYSV